MKCGRMAKKTTKEENCLLVDRDVNKAIIMVLNP